MKILSSYIINNWVVLIIISILYFSYSFLFIKPQNLTNFSLVDDGQVLIQSSHFFQDCIHGFRCEKILDQVFEFGSGRLRPSYWIINVFNYQIFGNNAELHHLYRVIVVGYASILLMTVILIEAGVSWPIILFFSTLFFTTFSFSENIIRLGTNEPYQILFLGLFSLLYLSKDRIEFYSRRYIIALTLLIIWLLGIKENNIAILPTVFITEWIFNNKRFHKFKNIFIIFLIPIMFYSLLFIIKKFIPSTISIDIPNYVSNYTTSPILIINNSIGVVIIFFNSLSPFLKLGILLLPILLTSKETRSLLLKKKFYYWFLFSTFFIVIIFPWKYVLDRYQLVGMYSLTILLALEFDVGYKFFVSKVKIFNSSNIYYNLLRNVLVLIICINLLSHGVSLNLAKTINYSNWFSQFTQFESDQVKILVKYKSNDVYINAINNLNDWEVLYELPIHLDYLYNIPYKVNLLGDNQLKNKYVFSRSSFDSKVPLNEITKYNSVVVDNQNYQVDQIDPLKFRDSFTMKPIETVLNPPLQKTGYNYSWEVRQILK